MEGDLSTVTGVKQPSWLRELSPWSVGRGGLHGVSRILGRGRSDQIHHLDRRARSAQSFGDGVAHLQHADHCKEALQEAFTRFGSPEIFNTDLGSQFTAKAFTDVLNNHAISISMDEKRRWVDNVFIERLWRSVKYEDIYLHAYETLREVDAELTRYFDFCNGRRPRQALDQTTPDAVYFAITELKHAA